MVLESASFLSLLWVDLLQKLLIQVLNCRGKVFSLEGVQAFLPASVAFNANFHATKYHFLAASKVYSELHNVSIVYWIGFAFDARRT